MKARSLRRELSLSLSLALLAVWVAALGAAGLVLQERMDRLFDSTLQETAERILPLAVMEIRSDRARRDRSHSDHDDDEDDDDDHRPPRSVLALTPHDEYLTYVVRDREGRVLIYSHGADPEMFPKKARDGFSDLRGHRIFTRSTEDRRYRVQVAEPDTLRRRAVLSTLGLMLLPMLLLVPVSILAVGWLLRRGLRPVATLSVAVGARGADDLSPLPDAGLRAELVPIREAVNRLMRRLSRALEAERAFAANAAHELRTPIAATLAQTQRLVAETPEGPLRTRALAVEAELKRVTRLAEKLLQLARAEGAGVIVDRAADLRPILAALVEDLTRNLPPGRLATSVADQPVLSRLDPDAFGVLARNLIENALVHGSPDAPVLVGLSGDGTFTVRNDCPALAPEVLSGVTTRFERGGARGPGSGLGLAIAAGIARALREELRLTSPIPGTDRGLEVAINVRGSAAG